MGNFSKSSNNFLSGVESLLILLGTTIKKVINYGVFTYYFLEKLSSSDFFRIQETDGVSTIFQDSHFFHT